MATRFIPNKIVSTIHSDLLQRYGGRPGLRDPGLLDSALAQPKMTVGGKFAHKSLFDKAAAYGFHVCKNHPFVDGNKRVAFVLMDIFLQKNGWEITANEEEASTLQMA
jgi:death-on-curing protein